MKKLLTFLVVLLGLASCGVNGSGNVSSSNNSANTSGNTTGNSSNCGTCSGTEIDLDAINEYFLTDDTWKNLNSNGNKVTLIPFTHINGPRAEWNFFAIVNFEYNATYYYKYQVTYLSCTCRSAEVNYWQTAYVELTVPSSGNIDDVKLRTLSFEKDGSKGHYIAGFWGDSGTNGYDINGSGITYEDIRDGFIPYLVGKTYAQLSAFDGWEDSSSGKVYDDTVFGIDKEDFNTSMADKTYTDSEGNEQSYTLDYFNGASVSTNNIIRMLIPLMEYHAANNI